MKKVYGIIFTILLLVTGLYIINKPKAQTTYPGSGRELSAIIPEDGFAIYRNGNEITVRTDGSQNLDDYVVAINGSCMVRFKFSINAPTGQTLHKGDYFTINTTRYYAEGSNAYDSNFVGATWEDLIDSSGTIIGQWRLISQTIQVVLNENVNGKTSINNVALETTPNSFGVERTAKDRVGKIKVNNRMFYYKIAAKTLVKNTKDYKTTYGTSNYRIFWDSHIGIDTTNQLWNSKGASATLSDTLFEDTFEGATDVEVDWIRGRLEVPYNLGTGGISSANAAPANMLSKYTKIVQLNSETYEEFKQRIMSQPLQYGVYVDEHNVYSVVIYNGKLGKDTPKYTNDNITNAVNKCISDYWYDESERETLQDLFTQSYMDGITNGSATYLYYRIAAYYPKASAERKIQNTAKVTYDGVEKELKATGTLAPTAGSGETTESSVTVTKKAQDTGAVLKGAKLKLQFKDGTDWVDYYINNKLEETTNDNGQVTFNNLAVGTYRVVETEAPKRYKSGATSEEFEVRSGSSSNIQIELLNEVATHKITTHHYKQGSTESLGESKTETKEYGDTYQTSPLTNIPEGYELVGTPSNASGTVEKDEIVIYEYKLKDVELTIRYVDENGTEISSIKEPHKYGDSYTTSPMDNDEYELVSTPNNASGTIKENTTVTYTYKKKEVVPETGTITVKYVDSEGNEISSSEVSTKEVGTTYTSKPKEIEGYVIKEKPSTESYTYTKEGQTVTYTYERIRLKVSTKVRGSIGGNIEGDEEVLYGENSTAGKIHIKANQGYVINKVYVNGSEIEVPKDSTELNISNFIKMSEDKAVEVEFKEIKKDLIVKVPPTSAQTIYTMLGMLGLIAIGIFGIYYNKKLS